MKNRRTLAIRITIVAGFAAVAHGTTETLATKAEPVILVAHCAVGSLSTRTFCCQNAGSLSVHLNSRAACSTLKHRLTVTSVSHAPITTGALAALFFRIAVPTGAFAGVLVAIHVFGSLNIAFAHCNHINCQMSIGVVTFTFDKFDEAYYSWGLSTTKWVVSTDI